MQRWATCPGGCKLAVARLRRVRKGSCGRNGASEWRPPAGVREGSCRRNGASDRRAGWLHSPAGGTQLRHLVCNSLRAPFPSLRHTGSVRVAVRRARPPTHIHCDSQEGIPSWHSVSSILSAYITRAVTQHALPAGRTGQDSVSPKFPMHRPICI